jgi:hypothetical protein
MDSGRELCGATFFSKALSRSDPLPGIKLGAVPFTRLGTYLPRVRGGGSNQVDARPRLRRHPRCTLAGEKDSSWAARRRAKHECSIQGHSVCAQPYHLRRNDSSGRCYTTGSLRI